MDQRIIDLYDEYTHAPLARRVFLERLAAMLGSVAAVPAVLKALEPDLAQAAVVVPDDPRVKAGRVAYQGASAEIAGYLVVPAGPLEAIPSVIVVHENRGLNAHIEDVARRLALEGFMVLAPDLLSPVGGTPPDADRARDLIRQLDQDRGAADLVAAISHLKARDHASGRVGAVGFCWGGGMVNRLAARAPDLDAGVVYYGVSPEPEVASTIKAPMLLHYAGQDERVNRTVPPFVEALGKAGVPHEAFFYEGAQHAFNNDTSAERYNAEAAALAWTRTVAFLKRTLGT